MRKSGIALLTAALAVVCGSLRPESRPAFEAGSAQAAAPAPASKKTVFEYMGRRSHRLSTHARKRGDDFFRFVVGSWFEKAVIPPEPDEHGSFLDLEYPERGEGSHNPGGSRFPQRSA